MENHKINPQLRPDTTIYVLLLLALLTALILTCSSCKSLAKRCSEQFPPELVARTMYLSSNTELPGSSLNLKSPCDELLKKLPESGEPVILGEDENTRLTGKKDSAGNLLLEALAKPKTIPKTRVFQSSDSKQTIPCDCSEDIKAAKWDMITDSLTYLGIGVLVLLFLLYLYRRK